MLMRDGVVMVSVMPFTNWPTSSLATPSACSRGRSPATLESLVLSIATTVSQYSRSFSRPFLAFLYLYLSKEKGSVTTPIFRMPSPGSAFEHVYGTSTGPSPQTCAKEQYARPSYRLSQLLEALVGRLLTHIRMTTCSLTVSELLADENPSVGSRHPQVDRVGVGGDEFASSHALLLYPRDNVAAGSAQADDAHHGTCSCRSRCHPVSFRQILRRGISLHGTCVFSECHS